jgi:Rrf2 family cysteine metabolism transcriptional repressor
MKLSTTNRYAVRAIVDIAQYQAGGPVSIHSISKRQDVSIKYLELILLPLKKAGLLKSTRGVKGGYNLTKDPSTITPGDIVRIVDGPVDLVDCLSVDHPVICPRIKKCSTRQLWLKLKQEVDKILDSTTIQELVNQQQELNKTANSV